MNLWCLVGARGGAAGGGGDSPAHQSVVATIASSNPNPIESDLVGVEITVEITGGVYDTSLATTDFDLYTSPPGTTIGSVTRDSDTEATLTLAYDGSDFDTDQALAVRVRQSALLTGDGPAITQTVTVTAVVEISAVISATSPDPLTEANLDTATVTVDVISGTYAAVPTSTDFALVGAPTGTTINSVVRDSDTSCTLTLAFDGTDFDVNKSMAVTVLQTALATGTGPATTGTVLIGSITEVSVAITSTDPTPLLEATLAGSDVVVTLTDGTFITSPTAGMFQLPAAPTGTSIASVVRDSTTQVTITLSFDGTSMGGVNGTLSVRVLQAALATGTGPATTATVAVTAGAPQDSRNARVFGGNPGNCTYRQNPTGMLTNAKFTFLTWFSVADLSTARGIMKLGPVPNLARGVEAHVTDTGNLRLEVSGGSHLVGSATLSTNTLYKIGFTKAATGISNTSIILNGAVDATGSLPAPTEWATDDYYAQGITYDDVGVGFVNGKYAWSAWLQDVELTATEVDYYLENPYELIRDYGASGAVVADALKLYWSMQCDSGTSETDLSGVGNTGTHDQGTWTADAGPTVTTGYDPCGGGGPPPPPGEGPPPAGGGSGAPPGTPVASEDFTGYTSTSGFLASSKYSSGEFISSNLFSLDESVFFNGHHVLKYTLPASTNAAPAFTVLLASPLAHVWTHEVRRYVVGFDTQGNGIGGAAYKVEGGGWDGGYIGRPAFEIANRYQYQTWLDIRTPGGVAMGAESNSALQGYGSKLITDEWTSGAWYHYVLHFERTSATTAILTSYKWKDGDAVPTGVIWTQNTYSANSGTLPLWERFRFGDNYNQVRLSSQNLSMWLAQWEIYDGATNPDPFGLL